MNINIDSIMPKVKEYVKSDSGKKRMRDKIKEYREKGVTTTAGGGNVLTTDQMSGLGLQMIRILKETAEQSNLPQSVLAHFDSLEQGDPRKLSENTYQVDIFFWDDLGRMSLMITSGKRKGELTGDGVENIVSLFDTGYSASKQVFGIWNGHEDLGTIGSRRELEGRYFIEKAVSEFNIRYGEEYNVHAYVSAPDKFYSLLNDRL